MNVKLNLAICWAFAVIQHGTQKFTLKLLICKIARQLIPINFAIFVNNFFVA